MRGLDLVTKTRIRDASEASEKHLKSFDASLSKIYLSLKFACFLNVLVDILGNMLVCFYIVSEMRKRTLLSCANLLPATN